MDILSNDVRLSLQGDKVQIFKRQPSGEAAPFYLATVVHVIGIGGRSLRLVNREVKACKPDYHMMQHHVDGLRPAPANKDGAKWHLIVK